MSPAIEIDIHDRPTLPGPSPRIDTASEAFFALGELPANDVEREDEPTTFALTIRRMFFVRVVAVVCGVAAAVVVAALLA